VTSNKIQILLKK